MFDPNIILKTERLTLRFINKDDNLAMYENIFHDEDVLKYFIADYIDDFSKIDMDKSRDFAIAREVYIFSVIITKTNENIGMMLECSKPDKYFQNVEIGYAFGKKYWNNGYATEALKEMIEFEFQKGISKVYSGYITENISSKRVMEKCNMLFECKKIKEIKYHDMFYDLEYYYILNPKVFNEGGIKND